MNAGLATNGNRAARRATGQRGTRPFADLVLTKAGPFVFLGFRGSGFVRLTAAEARALAADLAVLADRALAADLAVLADPDPEELAP